MIFTATVSILLGLRSAPGAFAGGEDFVIFDASAPTVFSSQLDIDMVDALRGLSNITGASPEIFAFSSWNGVSFVVRGLGGGFGDLGWPKADDVVLAGEAGYDVGSSALIGCRLLDRLGFGLPYVLPLVGSYSSKVEFVKVVGSFDTGTPFDDEVLVPLSVARHLSGVPDDKVSVIRVATSEPRWLSDILSPTHARFALFDLHLSKSEVVSDEAIDVEVKVLNWGTASGSTSVRFMINDQPFAEEDVSLNGSESKTLHQSFVPLPLWGTYWVNVSIAGDFPVKLSAEFRVVEAYISVWTPSRVLLDTDFVVNVTTYTGEPAAGASVDFDGQQGTCDSNGSVTMHASELGSFLVTASYPDTSGGSSRVEVVDPSAFPNEFRPTVTSFLVSPLIIRESETAHGRVVVENDGTLSGSTDLTVYIDSSVYLTLNVSLAGMSSQTLSFEVKNLEPGTHVIQVGTFSAQLDVQPWFADSSDLVRLVVRYGGSSSLSSATGIPIHQAAKISESNIAVALFSIGAVSALLAFLAVTSIFSKEIHEGRHRLGVLRTIGASKSDVRRLVFPQALENGIAGAAVGVAVGVAISDWLSKSGAFLVFGHDLTLELNTELMVLVLVAAVLISVLSALASAYLAGRETAISSIRRLEEEQPEPVDVSELLGDE
ncbi:MAG: FtsX-like permease family protein [Thermoplasmata archaeon]